MDKHEISITPRWSLNNLVGNIIFGRGNRVQIAGVEYVLREKGTLSKEDPIRVGMLRRLEDKARVKPNTYSSKVELRLPTKKVEDSALVLKYIRVDNIPDNDEGNHQYFVFNGTTYRVEVLGNLRDFGGDMPTVIRMGREYIDAYIKSNGSLPNGIEIGMDSAKRNHKLKDLID